MAAPTFAPPQAPSFPLNEPHEPKVDVVPFGDGYSQRSRAGINHDLESVEAVWENLDTTEAKAIFAFLKARGGDQSFWYQFPFWGDGTDELLLWTAPTYSRAKNTAGAYTVKATFKRVVEAG